MGGTGTAAEIIVDSVNAAGKILTFTISDVGAYTVKPANPVKVTGGAGLGAKFTLVYGATGAVAGVTILQAGAYTVEPANNAGVTDVTTPAAIGATFTLAYSATGVGAAGVPIAAATGSGYKVGQVLTVVGGTFTVAAQLTVTAIDAGGGIMSATISNAGSYTAGSEPPNPVSVTGGTGTSAATFTLAYIGTTVQVATAPVAAVGSGYKVGDLLTVTGGTFTTAAQLTVATVNGAGGITGVTITQAGSYTGGFQPANPVSVTDATTPAATGAKFNLTYTSITTGATGTPAAGGTGSGYVVGDVLMVQGGTGTATQLTVTAVDANGAVTGATISQPGSYTDGLQPANPVSVTDATTPTAAGAEFDLVYSPTATGAEITLTLSSASGTGPIIDATKNPAGSGPDIPGIVAYTIPVSITDPAFVVGDLEVTVDIVDPHLSNLQMVLTSPTGIQITLLNNHIDGSGNVISPPQGVADAASSANGIGTVNADPNAGFSSDIGTVFDQNAPRPITDGSSASAPYAAHFQPEVGSLADFNGEKGGAADLTGLWTLQLTDVKFDNTPAPNPFQRVDSWSLHFTAADGLITTAFGKDKSLGVAPVAGAPSASTPYALANTGPYGPAGRAPSLNVAIDNSLGAFSPYQGRLYLAYTGGSGVFLASVDDVGSAAGLTLNPPVQVNDDSVLDGFSEGNRPEFMPTVAVDDVTGTVGVMYYDDRWDPSMTRVANSFSDSIDGGQTFSPSTTLNTESTAFNEITGAVVDIGPIPGNQGAANPQFGFGDRQGLVMVGGHVIPIFSSNENAAGNSIMTASVTIAAGPRIIAGDMGAITNEFTTDGAIYNDTFAPDGTRQFSGFEITFDRPIDITTFTPSQVAIMYRDTVTPATLPGVVLPTSDFTVIPLDAGGPFGLLSGVDAAGLATTFLIAVTPQSAVGTYSYAIGNQTGAPVIRDRLETATVVGTVGTTASVGNFMDENQDAVTGEVPDSLSTATSLVIPPNAFGLPPNTGSKYSLNDILTVNGGTFSSAATIRVTDIDTTGAITGVKGSILGAVLISGGIYTADPASPVTASGGTGSAATFDLTFVDGSVGDVFAIPTPVAPAGATLSNAPFQLPYSSTTLPLIVPGPQMVDSSVNFNPQTGATSDNLVLNGTNNGLDVSFDRNIQAGTFTAANIVRIDGPVGPITPYTLGPTVTFTSVNGLGSGAMGVASIVGGFVTAVNILNPGSGYTSAPPTVVFNGGGGTGATATATISLATGKVTGVTVTSGGIGYTSATPADSSPSRRHA